MSQAVFKRVAIGIVVGLVLLMVCAVAWLVGAVETNVFGDGCPDTFVIAPLWWRVIYFSVIPALLLAGSVYVARVSVSRIRPRS